MSKAPSTVYIFLPPLKKMSGGLAVLVQVARHLQEINQPVSLAFWDENLPQKLDCQGIPLSAANSLQLQPQDFWIVSEGWPNALSIGLKSSASSWVYCQNWAYLFHGLPPGLLWRDLPVRFIAVSDPVACFIHHVTGQNPPIIRPSINTTQFHPGSYRPNKTIRIAFMPRKNKDLVQQIQNVWRSRNQALEGLVEWIPIHGVDQAAVADILQTCQIFLVAGFPEGCPLPPLEAMACGCIPVGFTGFGGWDYMRQSCHQPYSPAFPLRQTPWGGNGLWVADGDVYAASLALEQAVSMVLKDSPDLKAIQTAGEKTVHAYSWEQQEQEVIEALALMRTDLEISP